MPLNKFILSALFCATLTSSAPAATLVLTYFDGSAVDNGTASGSQEPVSPYYGTLDGNAITMYCDDVIHNIYQGATNSVNVLDVTSPADLAKTRFGALPNAVALYEQAFYLTTFLNTATTLDHDSYQTIRADIGDAIWSLFDSNLNLSHTDAGDWLNQAASNYQNYSYSNFRVLTDSSIDATHNSGGIQEQIINTTGGLTPAPEPGTVAMLGAGIAALAILHRRRSA